MSTDKNQRINDGGPAFPLFLPPSETGGCILPIQYGMTLRDYFAAKAMQGILANTQLAWYNQPSNVASYALECADAMLKAREAKP